MNEMGEQGATGVSPTSLKKLSRTKMWLVMLWLASLVPLGVLYMKVPPSPDQAQFDYMAWLSTQGLPFYAGSFDVNWPGAMILHEIAIRAFGPQAWSWHLGDFLLMQACTLGGALFLRRSGFALAPFTMLVLYPPLYVTAGEWTAGQRDIIAMGLLVTAGAFAIPGGRREASSMLLAGGLVGFVFLIRPTYLSVLVGLLMLEVLPLRLSTPRRVSRGRRSLLLLAGFAIPVLGVALAGVAVGALDDWYQQSILFTTSIYADHAAQDPLTSLHTLFVISWHWLSLCSVLGLILWIFRGRLSYSIAVVLGLGAAAMLSFYVQGKGFGYHLGGFLTLLTLLTAVAIDHLWTLARTVRPGWPGMVANVLLLLVVSLTCLGTAKKLTGYARYLADIPQHGLQPVQNGSRIDQQELETVLARVVNSSGPEDRFVLYGRLYQVPYLAQLRPSYRFITPGIELMDPEFRYYEEWLAEIRDGLKTHPPAFVLIERSLIERKGTTLSSRSNQPRPVLGILLEHISYGYEIVQELRHGYLLQRTRP